MDRDPDRAFGEYDTKGNVASIGRVYAQTDAGVIAKDGKIALLRKALDTLAALRAFTKD